MNKEYYNYIAVLECCRTKSETDSIEEEEGAVSTRHKSMKTIPK